MASPYRRVILKLSGEALGLDGKLFCHEKFEQVARMLIDIQHTGVELAVVIGGGNVWRGRRGAAMRMGTVAADQMLSLIHICSHGRERRSGNLCAGHACARAACGAQRHMDQDCWKRHFASAELPAFHLRRAALAGGR